MSLSVAAARAADAPVTAPPSTDAPGAGPAAEMPTAQPAAAPTPASDHPTEAPSSPGDGPVRTANNAIYAEGLGPGLFYSINYERTIADDFSARIGFGYVSIGASAGSGANQVSASASYLTVPITVSYLGIGSKKHIFELGGGASILHVGAGASTFVDSASVSQTLVLPTILAGYRIQPPDGGFFFKIGASPFLIQGHVIPYGYLALGGVF